MSLCKAMGKHLFLIEAEHHVREQRLRQLQQQGHEVAAESQSGAALDQLRLAPPPDLIVIDPFTPNLNGREFTQALLLDARLARVPVVVLGGPDLQASFPGASGFVPRPADATDLLRAVEQFARRRKPGILMVEDHSGVLLMLDKALEYFGFVPRLAASGQVALEVFRRDRAAIDLVLLDVLMTPMDGPQTLAALRQIDPQVRAVFMSGDVGNYSADDLLARGAARVFAKPFALAELAEQLWHLLEGPTISADPMAQPA
jgi:two-component system, OmpR family, response regulator